MALYNAYSARNAMVRFGAVVVTAKRWTVTPKADKNDSSNFEGGGFGEKQAGLREVTVTIELDDNATTSYFDANVIGAGNNIASVKLYLNGNAGPYWSFPFLFVESPSMQADVRQNMGLTINAESNGPFAYPTGLAGVTT